ncbi:MAG: polyprenyl synthetase family protein [Candidatus Sumerlaeia bacterium]|nr:polyprenyl synthetase family protein [Candidatus Sumerlaeia bacterium]
MTSATTTQAPQKDPVSAYLGEDLDLVRQWMDRIYQPEGRLMTDVARYIYELKGKLLRPKMVCLAARAYGHDPDNKRYTRIAAAMEIFHVATLLHDDVIDHADARRGRETVNHKWGADVAILFADYLYASCFDLALSGLDERPDALRILTRTTQKMAEGEIFQIEKRGCWLTLEEYMKIIRLKTGCLFGACASLGTLVAGQDTERVLRMADYGMAFGVAFQMTDDALDYDADPANWGKPVGGDVAEGKQTYPLLHAYELAGEDERRRIAEVMSNGRDFATVHGFVARHDGVRASFEKAEEHIAEALAVLDEATIDHEAMTLLKGLTRGIAKRRF